MTPLLPAAPRSRTRFHTLTVTDKTPLTDTSAAVSFGIPDALADDYAFQAGQHLTLRRHVDGQEVRRSYSICRSPADARARRELRIAGATVPGGLMSTWLVDDLAVGDRVDVMTPAGTFTCPTRPDQARHHVAIAAGSGITPVLSLITTALHDEPRSRVTLIYGNRRADSVMFLDELDDLKNTHPTRLQIVHVLSREARDVDLLTGRLDTDRIDALLTAFAPVADEWYLCGPQPVVDAAQQVLAARGADPGHVHHELFHVADAATPATVVVDESAPPAAVVTVTLDGRTTRIPMPTRDESILAATLRARPDAPYSCTGGVCGTCRARVVSGDVRMARNYALEPDEVAAGYVLACQAHPVGDDVVLDYD